MARPKQYPVALYVRLSEETYQNLLSTAKIMDLQPAVAARVILDANLRIMPDPKLINKFKEDNNGSIQQKK